jgi:hypothetical protein
MTVSRSFVTALTAVALSAVAAPFVTWVVVAYA